VPPPATSIHLAAAAGLAAHLLAREVASVALPNDRGVPVPLEHDARLALARRLAPRLHLGGEAMIVGRRDEPHEQRRRGARHPEDALTDVRLIDRPQRAQHERDGEEGEEAARHRRGA
jgi:hypothetical protein